MRTKTKTVPLRPAFERLGFLLYRVGWQVATAYEEITRPLGFSPVEIGVMTHLATTGEDENHIRSIARALGVSPQTVANTSLRLEKERLVVRRKGQGKGGAVQLSMTGKGRRAIERIDAEVRSFDAGLEQALGAARAQRMVRDLKKLLGRGEYGQVPGSAKGGGRAAGQWQTAKKIRTV